MEKNMSSYDNDPKILKRLYDFLDDYEKGHSKIQVTRFDVRYPENYNKSIYKNADISKFKTKLNQYGKRQGYDTENGWVREQNLSEHPHYHFLVLQDGHKIQSPYKLFKKAEQLWGSTIGCDPKGLIDHCNKDEEGNKRRNGAVHKRGERPEDVDRQLAYMAKQYSKGKPKDGIRNFGVSRRKKQS